MKTFENITALADLASTQWGMFTSAQALAEGVSRTQLSRMANDGRIEPMARGTYRFSSSWSAANDGARAAWLSLFPTKTAYERLRERPRDAIVAGRTAAVLLGDTDLHAQPYCFAAGSTKRTARSDVRLLPWSIDERDVVIVDGLPVSSPERTIADLVRLREDPSLIGNFTTGMAARGHIFNKKRLATLLTPLAARNGYRKNDGTAFAQDILSQYAVEPTLQRIYTQAEEAAALVGPPTTEAGAANGVLRLSY